MALFGLLNLGRHDRVGFQLYGMAVLAARDPFLFETLQVPDTLDGRFDMIGLHAYLLIRRLQRIESKGGALAQAVFDAMFSDMDSGLREIGVGDLSVGKKVKAMWEAFHGRALSYGAALGAGDQDAMKTALLRNVWRSDEPPADIAQAMARCAWAQDQHLSGQPDSALLAGQVHFLPAAEAAR